jgi:hypothetical protein
MTIPYLLYLTKEVNDCVILRNKKEKLVEILFKQHPTWKMPCMKKEALLVAR